MDVLDPAFPSLVRSARALLGWSQSTLAFRAKVSNPFISRIERMENIGRPANLKKIEKALRDAGVMFRCDESGFGVYLTGEAAQHLRRENRAAQIGDQD